MPPALDVPERPLDELIPAELRRSEPARLPEVSEPEIVRHYNRLSKRNFDLDTGFYPLGSCTMKHNPKLHERVAALPGHARLHPLQRPEAAQGALELMWRLQNALGEISGLPHVSLQPSAGSHGELAGVLLTRAYHEDRGEHRTKVLTPDTAHGTNPATVTMAGYELVKVGTDANGNVDIEDLRAKATEDVACLMLTNPSTLGLFEPQIEEIAAIVHRVGATLYYDGANLNAIMGICRPGDMGFDIVHFNLHKSFTQPHGGGGPGAGPIAVSDRIEPFLPRPQVVRRGDGDLSTLIRTVPSRSAVCAASRATTASSCAATPTSARSAQPACARYPRWRCSTPTTCSRACVRRACSSISRRRTTGSACTSSCSRGAPMKRELGIRTLDLAKRLLDHGVHPPTVYFPLIVDEAVLWSRPRPRPGRPSTASPAVAEILREAADDPEIARGAPIDASCDGSMRPARRGGRCCVRNSEAALRAEFRDVCLNAGVRRDDNRGS